MSHYQQYCIINYDLWLQSVSAGYDKMHQKIRNYELSLNQLRDEVKKTEENYKILCKATKEAVKKASKHSERIDTTRTTSSIDTEMKKIQDRLLKNADKYVRVQVI